jgi:hypothetical protein
MTYSSFFPAGVKRRKRNMLQHEFKSKLAGEVAGTDRVIGGKSYAC